MQDLSQTLEEYVMKKGQYEEEKSRVNRAWNEFFDMVSKQKEAHEAFMEEGVVPPAEIIDRDIVCSWQKSLKIGLDPRHIVPMYVEGKAFQELFEANKNLMAAAEPVLEEFARQFSTSLFTVDLYDKDLILLKRYGKKEEVKPEKAYIKPGLIKSEETSGITSMSFAIMRGKAVQLIGGEHFSNDLMEHVCTAAPIYFEGKLVGLVNVIEFQWEKDNRTLGTLVGLARLIENNYKQQKLQQEIVSEAAVNEEIIRVTSEGILLISATGEVIKASPHACTLLGMAKSYMEGHDIREIFGPNNIIQAAMDKKMSITDQEIDLSIHGTMKRFMGYIKIIQNENQVSKVMVSIRDLQSLRNIIKRVGGWDAKYTFQDILGTAPLFRKAVSFAKETAMLDSNTLIEGESGTGKELFAQAIHNASMFSSGPFVSVNCGSIPASLLESELFGYENGSFTGARKGGQIGKFELAEGGTIFLDEINSLAFDMQVKILRVLQEKTICRIGGSNNVQLHIKVIAASNENLWDLVQKGEFRADLFYRLNVITIHIPPLRQHPGDIPEIAQRIINRLTPGGSQATISDEAYRLLMEYHWPGNIRELENTIERGLVNARLRGENHVRISDIENAVRAEIKPLQEMSRSYETVRPIRDGRAEELATMQTNPENREKEEIIACLRANRGNISATARTLGIARNTLYQKLYKYDIHVKNY